MDIEKSANGSAVELKLSGWLDTETSPMLKDEIDALGESVTSLVIDCTALEYVSSAGIRQLVAAHKKMGGALALRNVSDEVMSILDLAGLAKRLHFES